MVPESNTFSLRDEITGNICLLLNFSAEFVIPYNKKNQQIGNVTVPFNPLNVFVGGFCLNETQEIILNWRPTTMPSTVTTDWQLIFTFTKLKANSKRNADGSSYSLSQITVVYIYDKTTFPDSQDEGFVQITTKIDNATYNAPIDKAYHCQANKTILLTVVGMTMMTRDFEVQAFRNSKTKTFDNGDQHCSEDEDSPHNALVPIIVGIILTLLVIIVLVAYFVGRRRQQRGNNYEQL
jgi:hypothetical protein